MQRWIVAGVVAAVLMVLGLGGAYFGYRSYKASRPHPVWVPLPINPELETAKRDEIIRQLKEKLSEPERLEKISRDIGLPGKWQLAGHDACARELASRLFVRSGDADTPMGKVPAIHVGITGKAKDSQVSGEIAMRLMEEVWPILGIKPPDRPAPR